MKISVDHIKEKALALQFDEPVDHFPLLAEMQANGVCRFTGTVNGVITAAREYDHLRVSGDVTVSAQLTCSRCLASYETDLRSNFTIFFRKGVTGQETDEDETELNDQDLISATYSGDEIDLAHEIEEQVAMEVPFKPLCSDACKGLCPSCGTELNNGDCTCEGDSTDFRFSALKNFKANR